MSDTFDSTSLGLGNLGASGDMPKAGEAELQEFLVAEQHKQQFNSQIHELNEMCWDKCMDKPAGKLDARTETCLANCVGRFLDTSFLITNRFAQLIQKGGAR